MTLKYSNFLNENMGIILSNFKLWIKWRTISRMQAKSAMDWKNKSIILRVTN